MAKFNDIIQGKGLSPLPLKHLQQIGLFLWRKGIELRIIDDCEHTPERQAFLDNLWHKNQISLYLDDIWRRGARSGEILLYMRPWGNGYTLLYYDASQFTPYYDDNNELQRVVIRSVEIDGEEEINVTTELRRDRVEVWRGESTNVDPDFSMTNPYGFVPAVVIQNIPRQGGRGYNEFYFLESPIEQHDWFIDQVAGNVEFFGGPLFYSSRSRSELIEAGLSKIQNSIAEQQGFGYYRQKERLKVKQIVAGLEEGEQIGFVTPEPIDSESLNFIQKYESDIVDALGGSSVSSGQFVTSSSLSQTFAIPLATAAKRANSYITYGLAKIYQLALEMAVQDGFIPADAPPRLYWRYTGDIFPDTAQNQLTKSIVSRNLIRLGVNLFDAIQHIFPDKSREEIESLLDNGFAYELLNGVSQVGAKFDIESSPELFDKLKEIIFQEVDNARGESGESGESAE